MQSADGKTGVNHPLAVRMAIIAFLCQSITFACMWGAFGVLLAPVEARLSVGRDLSSLAVPLVSIGSALLAPVVGILAGKISLRVLMMIGAVMSIAGYLLLALSHSIAMYLVAYGLLVGPGMCLCGQVLPSTLVARWFAVNRGRALGFVHLPIVLTLLPLIIAYILRAFDLPAAYGMLAGLMAVALLPMLFIVDFPPSATDPSGEDETAEALAHPSATTGEIIREPRFWALVLGMAAILSGQIMFSAHLVPMAMGWGVNATTAAGLLSLTALAGMAGALILGWVADKLGGRLALVIACLDSIVLWLILLAHPPVAIAAAVVALIGFHGAAGLPLFGMAASQLFGQASFGRAFGLGTLGMLPFMVAAVPIAAMVYVRTGSYSADLVGHTVFFVLAAVLILVVGRARPTPQAQVQAQA
jgi:MFS family permease